MPKQKHKKQAPQNIGEGLLSITSGDFLRPDKNLGNVKRPTLTVNHRKKNSKVKTSGAE